MRILLSELNTVVPVDYFLHKAKPPAIPKNPIVNELCNYPT